jgi:hypothetical protein
VAFWIWAVSLTLVTAAALWKGGASERVAAGAYYAAWIVSILVQNPDHYATQWSVFLVDVILFLMLTGVALRSPRYWPIFMAAFQLLAVITHTGRVVDSSVGAWAYLTGGVIWGYLSLFALAYGTWGAWKARRQLARAAAPAAAPGATRL